MHHTGISLESTQYFLGWHYDEINQYIDFTLISRGLATCPTASEEEADTILIGVNLELTGDVSFFCVRENNAFEKLDKWSIRQVVCDCKSVESIVKDNAYHQARTVQSTENLIEGGVVAILGSATSGLTMVIASLVKEKGLVVFTTSETNSAVAMKGSVVHPWVFHVCIIDPF